MIPCDRPSNTKRGGSAYITADFADNFEMTLKILAQKNPFLITANGDFNSKSTNWWNKDKINFEDNTQLEI